MDRDTIRLAIKGFRGFLWKGLIVVIVCGILSFSFAKGILRFLIGLVGMKVYYFGLSEAFFASVELAMYAGIFFALPALIYLLWHEFKGLFPLKPVRGYFFISWTIILFYAGAFFCCYIVLPSGIRFLLGFGSATITPMISVQRFVTFSSAMIFAFGVTFEVPIILLILGRLRIIHSRTLTRTRRFAILFIAIASALITPTPDVYNMMLLAVPAYILYEAGILLMKIGERKREANLIDLT
jgi:sec-independent protein translocase protein TatC